MASHRGRQSRSRPPAAIFGNNDVGVIPGRVLTLEHVLVLIRGHQQVDPGRSRRADGVNRALREIQHALVAGR